MNKVNMITCCLACFLLSVAVGAQSQVCVDDDNTTGIRDGSARYPYQTIAAAQAAAYDGDELCVAAGDYAPVTVTNHWYVFRGGYAGGSSADYGAGGSGGDFSASDPQTHVSRISATTNEPGFALDYDASGTVIDSFRITGGLHGVRLEGWPGSTNISIRNNTIEDNGVLTDTRNIMGGGIAVFEGSQVVIENNTIRNNRSGLAGGIGTSMEGTDIAIRGNTIAFNQAGSDHGGGLFLGGTGILAGNSILGNEVGVAAGFGWGGGLIVVGESTRYEVSDNLVMSNTAPDYAGGIYIDEGAHAVLTGNIIARNHCAGLFGAGVGVDGGSQSQAILINCTVVGNTGGTEGGNGVFVEAEADAYVTNCIFWGNGGGAVGADFHVAEPATASLTVNYSLSAEPVAGAGNFQVDPGFADEAANDFHLRSTGGRWDSLAAAWANDPDNSYALDAGDPASSFALEPPPNGNRINLGAYGNTAQASRTPAVPTTPSAPANVAATDGDPRIEGLVRITWSAVPGPIAYTVDRAPMGSTNTTVIASDLTALTIDDVGVTGTNQYRVRASSGSSTGPWSTPEVGYAYYEPTRGVRKIVLQQGFNGTTHALDTWISDADWGTPPGREVNHGRDAALFVSDRGSSKALLVFDLSAIPSHSRIDAAELRLYNLVDTGGRYRRHGVHIVSTAWESGNQSNDVVDAVSDFGATGEYANQVAADPGQNVSWGAIGMAAGIDYDTAPLAGTDVSDSGWYAWDVRDAARAWVRGDRTNAGVVLIDTADWDTDYYREFASGEYPDDELRPALYITYNPDVPFVDAGPDLENRNWYGIPVTLDASACHDYPGGDDASLSYEWRIVSAAYGSALSGVVGTNIVQQFTPDEPGEWIIELTVSNARGESASDPLELRLLSIPLTHPRIYLSPGRVAELSPRAVAGNPEWDAVIAEAGDPDGEIAACALAWRFTGDTAYARTAITRALGVISGPDYPVKGGDLALIYDWCHSELQPAERTTFTNYFASAYAAWTTSPDPDDVPGWGNYWPRYSYTLALMGLATSGELAEAPAMMDAFRTDRYGTIDRLMLDRIADGGGWPEGFVYDGIANRPRMKTLEAWRTATGEDLFASSAWYRNRLAFFLVERLPGVAWYWSYAFHPYIGDGDSERGRGSIANYHRIMALILISRFPNDPAAQQLQSILTSGATSGSMGFLAHEEFLWLNPSQPTRAPTMTAHYAGGLGWINARSGWPSGAADTNTEATVLAFRCGDHFSYHQHFEQNSLTLHKREPLLVDSGVYSQEGLSVHDQNYYVRTIAHNTLVVYNPDEDFSEARPDAYSNDGGQRTVYPASRSPLGTQYMDQYAEQYETGTMERYEDTLTYLYSVGDATAAYNNPDYNQVQDGLTNNVAKVTRFEREVVYLRPLESGGPESVVLFDRVGVADSRFSGENTKLLFHTLNEPMVDGSGIAVSAGETLYAGPASAVVEGTQSRLFMTFVSPSALQVRKVGGRGVKSFWVFGENFDYQWDVNEPQPRPVNDFETEPYGEWRLEVEPADSALDHEFLTVLQPVGLLESALPVAAIESTSVRGVALRSPGCDRVVVFPADADIGRVTNLAYKTVVHGPAEHLIADLVPSGRYALAAAWTNSSVAIRLALDPAGAYTASAQGIVVLGDQDGDGLFDAWEVAVGLNPSVPTGADGAGGDPDGDGVSNVAEQRSGTHASDAGSRFAITDVTLDGGNAVVRWTSAADRRYRIERSLSLAIGPWSPALTNIQATPPFTEGQDPAPGLDPPIFYRVAIEP